MHAVAGTCKLICLGGSFNPIHFGHLDCAQAAAKALGADLVVLIPSGLPPHKQTEGTLAPANDRLEMCRRAIATKAGFAVDDCEIHRPGPSYTILTVRRFKQRGIDEVIWLIGADMVAGLPNWHEATALMAESRLVVMSRPGYVIDWARLPAEFAALRHSTVAVPPIDISASDIRRRVRSRLPIDGLTPPAVCQYIRERKLYGG